MNFFQNLYYEYFSKPLLWIFFRTFTMNFFRTFTMNYFQNLYYECFSEPLLWIFFRTSTMIFFRTFTMIFFRTFTMNFFRTFTMNFFRTFTMNFFRYELFSEPLLCVYSIIIINYFYRFLWIHSGSSYYFYKTLGKAVHRGPSLHKHSQE
jgi:hypothetical protein